MTNILIAACVMGLMGLLFGLVLAIIVKKFQVQQNPVQVAVRELLPSANCGACGYPGCDGYAEAVANGKALVNLCPVGGDDTAQRLGEIMGVNAQPQTRMVATVMCRGDATRCFERFEYAGPMDCKSASLVGQGYKACAHACLGLGDCQKACPFGAIKVNEHKLAYVDEDLCRGCKLCVDSCPRGILALMPHSYAVQRTCSAMERGKVVRDVCEVGCVSCGKCERSCKFGALRMQDNLPQINLDRCTHCMQCADNCPTGALYARNNMRRRAFINFDQCDGCDRCKKACRFEAIIQNDEGKHVVVAWNCTGCGMCQRACPKDCIRMLSGALRSRGHEW